MLTAREKILVAGEDDWVSLDLFHHYIALENPSASLAEVQRKTLELVQSMAAEGVIALGQLKDFGARFVPWDIPLDDGIARLAAEYVDRFDDGTGWPMLLWLMVTDSGKTAARECRNEYAAWLAERREQGREYEAIPARLAPGGPHDD